MRKPALTFHKPGWLEVLLGSCWFWFGWKGAVYLFGGGAVVVVLGVLLLFVLFGQGNFYRLPDITCFR